MNALSFDTLRFAKRMQEAGLPQPQAEALAEALSDAVHDTVATKADIEKAVAELRGEIADLRTEQRGDIASLRTEMRDQQVSMIKWLVPLLLGQAALTAALVKLL